MAAEMQAGPKPYGGEDDDEMLEVGPIFNSLGRDVTFDRLWNIELKLKTFRHIILKELPRH